jgi:hypothetical protein
MGILNGPRINFWGGIQTNVCTANNTNDPGNTPILDLAKAQVAESAQSMTDNQIIDWMRTPTNSPSTGLGYTESGWNYYGDHLVNFVDAIVSSEGSAGSVSTSGDLVSEKVYLLGSIDPGTAKGPFFGPVMVDLDPTSNKTTQIFIGGLQIGTGNTPKLLIQHDTVASSHNLNLRINHGITGGDSPGSDVANGTFQVTFPKSSVKIWDKSCSVLSTIMNDESATGFVLRFSMFEMTPYLTTDQLITAYNANQNPSNPSSGRVIGTLGPHYKGEPETCPPGRLLVNQARGGATGHAILTNDYLSIDTVSLMMQENFRTNRTAFAPPNKIGPNIKFKSINVLAGTGTTPVGSFNPRSTDYYLYGGIVDMPVDSTQFNTLSSNAMTLKGKNTSTGKSVKIEEQPLRIYSNARNIYATDFTSGSMDITCNVSYLGGSLNENTSFTLTSTTPGAIPNPKFLTFPSSISGALGATKVSFKVTNNGNNTPGFEQITIASGEASYFINFRNFFNTDFGIPAGATITWDQVYENVLRFYYVTFPAMSKRIPLNEEGTITATGPQILARTSDAFRDTTLYMPITRGMSPSQIKLLNAFLNKRPYGIITINEEGNEAADR